MGGYEDSQRKKIYKFIYKNARITGTTTQFNFITLAVFHHYGRSVRRIRQSLSTKRPST